METKKSFSFKNPEFLSKKVVRVGPGRGTNKNLKQIITGERYESYPPGVPTYASIEAPPSSMPVTKYCDVTGLPAKYTDPKSKLFFAGAEVHALINSMPSDSQQALLAIRNGNVQLK